MSRLFAGIDVGGTTIKSLVVDQGGTVVRTATVPTQSSTSSQICRVAVELVDANPEIASIGVVTPGVVDEDRGVVVYASNLDLDDAPVSADVARATRRPTLLGHDGRSAGLAETTFGAGRGVRSSLLIPIGTGISAALCLQGGVWPGETFTAGEIGHVPVVIDGEPCACGQKGCLEVYASATGIARRFHQLGGPVASAREVEAHLGDHDVADKVWSDAVSALAFVLTHLTLSVDPGRIIIAGGLSNAGETLLTPLRRRMASMLAWRHPPETVASELGGTAGQWGAAILACRAVDSTDYPGWAP